MAWSKSVPVVMALALVAAACSAGGAGGGGSADAPTVVVTTSLLGDVVTELVGDQLNVVTLMTAGVAPHEFQASARQIAALGDADVIVTNGGGLEGSILDPIAAAEADGTAVCVALDGVDTLDLGGDDRPGGGTVDPHFFTDPARMAVAASSLVECILENVDGLDADGLRAESAVYIDELNTLDATVEAKLAAIPDELRVLVTNHEVFGYFADRYGFEVVGVIIPGGSTVAQADARALADLAELVADLGIPVVFADTSSPQTLATALAGEVGGIEVVELYSESLGPAGSDGATYLDMVRANASRIADALADFGPVPAGERS